MKEQIITNIGLPIH